LFLKFVEQSIFSPPVVHSLQKLIFSAVAGVKRVVNKDNPDDSYIIYLKRNHGFKNLLAQALLPMTYGLLRKSS
jgi:hypothetical protein